METRIFLYFAILIIVVLIQTFTIIKLINAVNNPIEEQEVLRQKQNFEALFKNSGDAIALFNQHHEIIDINHKFSDLFGYTLEEIQGIDLDKVLAVGERETEASKLTKSLFNGYEVNLESIRYGVNKQPKEVSIKGVPIVLNGQIVGGYGIYTDISKRKKAEREILYMNYHDQLTGLYNRRFFEEELKRLDTERNLPISIIMADADGLKLINDAFGHAMGDNLIIEVAKTLKKACRSDEIIARLGGDEFVVLLHKASFEDTKKIVNRISKIAQDTQLGTIELSISLGWDTKNNENENIKEIFKKAEDDMYRNKLFKSSSMKSKTIETIISTLYKKDKGEELHSKTVGHLCELMGIAMDFTEREVSELKTAGILHDIGKIVISKNILNKSSNLTEDEFREMKRHSEIGYNILRSVNDRAELAEYVLAHHENWDGTGYPKGIKAGEIPLQARIIRIADAYDSMISEKPYRNTMTKKEVIEELYKNAGTQFDPRLISIFIDEVLSKT